MSYVCHACKSHVPHSFAQKRHIIYRPNKEIETEIPVCYKCAEELKNGATIHTLFTQHKRPVPKDRFNKPVHKGQSALKN